MEKSDFCTAKKSIKKPNPMKHSFVQLREKRDRLEKAIKKKEAKKKKHFGNYGDSDSV